jgi:hypothetical protein
MRRISWAAVVLLVGAAPIHAQSADSGAFVTRLGADTLAVERFVRTADSVWGEMVSRAPEIRRARYVAHLDRAGNVTAYELTFVNGGRVTATFQNDTVHLTMTVRDSTTHQAQSLSERGRVAGRYVVPLAEPAFGLHELAVVRAQSHSGTRVPFVWYYVGDGPDTGSVLARGDSAWITTPSDTIRLQVDAHGHIQSASDPGGTLQATVTRVAGWPDLDKTVAVAPLGALSPRATARGTIAGTNVVIDYGRPSRRGRVIFGNVIPFNTIWRTGANAATGFVIDRDLVLGTTSVPAGRYTLFSYITAKGWQLIVSKRTGEWGTEYDHSADLARISMRLDRNVTPPVDQFTISVQSDRIEMAWDTWKASVPVRAAQTTTGM